jgi:ATP/maltotriose-dependent transcriptional regulator MalT
VGRREELAALERALGEVERGDARAVGLWGEPGIGKSRLLVELAGRARERGLLVLEGRAAELERDLTFALLVDALEPLASDRTLAGSMGELEAWQLRELASVLPAVGPLAGPEVEGAPASGERHRVARAVRALLERLAAGRPLALLLDDVHWADPASADVLGLLLHRLPRAPVLLGLAARSGRAPALEAGLAAVQQSGTGQVVELGPLPPEIVEELLPQVGRAARERLYRESGGNPFYLQELARAGLEGDGAGRAALAGVPRAVQAALGRELAALPGPARRVLEGAAVAGDPFEPELAAVVADVLEEVALASLDELLAGDLVRATDQPRRFRFRHPLVRRAVYEEAGGGWRLAAHARAAQELEARGASPAQRAHHVERAARPGDLAAVELLAAAAREAAPAAPATAAGWCEAALRLLPDWAEHAERRLALLGAQGQALASAGRPGEARDVLRRLLAMTPREAAGERVRVVEALADLEALWLHNREEARRLLEAQREALGGGAPGLGATLTFALARERRDCADHEGAQRLAGQARAAARAAGDPVLEAEAAVTEADAAHCRLRRDDPAALAVVDGKIAEAGALVEALPDERAAERLQMLFWLGVARLFTGRFAPARSAAERGLSLARQTGQGLLAPSFLALRGFVDEELGRLDQAEQDEDEALESAMLTGNDHLEYWVTLVEAWIALARGRPDAALSYAERGWELAGVVPWSQVGWTLAEARLGLGDPRGALETLETFGGVNPGLWTLDRLKALDVLVRVLLALGRVEEATELVRRAPAEGGGRRTGVFGAILAHAEAGVLLARDAAPEAARVAVAGAAAGDQGLAALWAGRCRTLAGQALAAGGRADEARGELRRAAEELEARGAWGYRDAALRALRRLGDRPRPYSPEAAADSGDDRLAALSPREREVAALVAKAHTNAQIAAQLHLSERTVEKHVSSLLGKLGLSSRTAVVRLLRDETPRSLTP